MLNLLQLLQMLMPQSQMQQSINQAAQQGGVTPAQVEAGVRQSLPMAQQQAQPTPTTTTSTTMQPLVSQDKLLKFLQASGFQQRGK